MGFREKLRTWGLAGALTAGSFGADKPAQAQEAPEAGESDDAVEGWSASATPPSEPTGFRLNIQDSENTPEATASGEPAESEPSHLESPLEEPLTQDRLNNYRRYQSADGRKYFVDYQNRATRLVDATNAEIFISEDDDYAYYVIIDGQRLPVANFQNATVDTRGLSDIAGRSTNLPTVGIPAGFEYDVANRRVVPIGTSRDFTMGPSSLEELDQQGGVWK